MIRQKQNFIKESQRKTVVMGCTHPYWSSLQVGSQHLARQFARNGWEVHYFSAPVSPLHLSKLFDPEMIRRFKSSMQCSTIHEDGMIRSYVPFSCIVPDGRKVLRNKVVTHNWHKTMFPSLKRLQSKRRFGQTSIVYIDNLSYHFFLDQFKYEKSVFRVMDMHERFLGWKGEAFKLARKIARQVDLTLYSALGLKNYVDTLHANKTTFIPNGVDFDFFHSQKFSNERHIILKNIPDPILLYTGMIDSRLDFRLIKSAAESLPTASFVFAGPVGVTHTLGKMPANVYFTGPVPHDQLSPLMCSAKAGLIPFNVNDQMNQIQGIRPLKLFEYMASGLPVISARWPEVERLDSPALLYKNENEFLALVRKAIKGEYSPAESWDFAKRHSWERSFKELMSAIQEI